MRKYGVVESKEKRFATRASCVKADASPSGKAASPGAHSVRNRPALAAEARRQRRATVLVVQLVVLVLVVLGSLCCCMGSE